VCLTFLCFSKFANWEIFATLMLNVSPLEFQIGKFYAHGATGKAGKDNTPYVDTCKYEHWQPSTLAPAARQSLFKPVFYSYFSRGESYQNF